MTLEDLSFFDVIILKERLFSKDSGFLILEEKSQALISKSLRSLPGRFLLSSHYQAFMLERHETATEAQLRASAAGF